MSALLAFALAVSPAAATVHTTGLCHDKVRVTGLYSDMTPDGPHGTWHGCVKLWGSLPVAADGRAKRERAS